MQGDDLDRLPPEYQTPEGELEDWPAALSYLRAIERSQSFVVVAVSDPRLVERNPGFRIHATKQIGFLRRLPVRSDLPHIHRFGLSWPDREQPAGEFSIDERLFEGASLSTFDGTSFFGLTLRFGAFDMLVSDPNTSLEEAQTERSSRQKPGYFDLPTGSQIEEQLQAQPGNEAMNEIKREMDDLRSRLAASDVSVEAMSDAELLAAALRVRQRLTQSGRMSGLEPGAKIALTLAELKEALRESEK